MSGGAVLDADGAVIGILSAASRTTAPADQQITALIIHALQFKVDLNWPRDVLSADAPSSTSPMTSYASWAWHVTLSGRSRSTTRPGGKRLRPYVYAANGCRLARGGAAEAPPLPTAFPTAAAAVAALAVRRAEVVAQILGVRGQP